MATEAACDGAWVLAAERLQQVAALPVPAPLQPLLMLLPPFTGRGSGRQGGRPPHRGRRAAGGARRTRRRRERGSQGAPQMPKAGRKLERRGVPQMPKAGRKWERRHGERHSVRKRPKGHKGAGARTCNPKSDLLSIDKYTVHANQIRCPAPGDPASASCHQKQDHSTGRVADMLSEARVLHQGVRTLLQRAPPLGAWPRRSELRGSGASESLCTPCAMVRAFNTV